MSTQNALVIKDFREKLDKHYTSTITNLLSAKGVDPKQFIETVVIACKKNEKLLQCEPATLFAAVLASATVGLEPNTPYNLCSIIPYNNNKGTKEKPDWHMEAQFQIDYQGWIELFGKNDKIKHVFSEIVYDNDEFKEVKGLHPDLIHVPCEDSNQRGNRRGAYAIAYLSSGHVEWKYMSAKQIDSIKQIAVRRNKGKVPPSWQEENDPEGWMWKKTCIKQLAKMLPKTNEMKLGVLADDAVQLGAAFRTGDNAELILPELNEDAVLDNEQRGQDASAATAGLLNKQE